MARVNITVPDELLNRARAAGLNVSALTTAALAEELDRRATIAALDAYLADLQQAHCPVPEEEMAAARAWADEPVITGATSTSTACSAPAWSVRRTR